MIYGGLAHICVHVERRYIVYMGKKLFMGIGMLIKIRTIGLGIQSVLSKRVVFCGKT